MIVKEFTVLLVVISLAGFTHAAHADFGFEAGASYDYTTVVIGDDTTIVGGEEATEEATEETIIDDSIIIGDITEPTIIVLGDGAELEGEAAVGIDVNIDFLVDSTGIWTAPNQKAINDLLAAGGLLINGVVQTNLSGFESTTNPDGTVVLTLAAAAVPEPKVYILLGGACLLVGWMRSRKKQRAV